MWSFILNLFKNLFGGGSKVKYITPVRDVRGGGNVYCIGVSRDGTKMVAGMNGGYLYASQDSGATWSKLNSPSTGWGHVRISNDGQYITAIANNQYIYVSSNGGTSFTQKTNVSQSNDCLAMSSTGQYQYVGGWAGNLYRSTDFGATWAASTGASAVAKHGLACSSNGQYVVVANVNTSWVYTSSDFGANWTQRTNAGQRTWYGANISDDGTKIALGGYQVGIFTSTDSGANWTQRGTGNYWVGLTGSANGTNLLAWGSQTANPGLYEFWASSDSGVNWTKRTTIGNNQDQFGQQSSGMGHSDAAGNFVVCVPNQFVKTSTDNGLNWTNIDTNTNFPKQYQNFAMSGNGKVGFLTETPGGRIHYSTDGLQTWNFTAPMRRNVVGTSYDGSLTVGIAFTQTTYSSGAQANYPAISTDKGQNWTDKTSATSGDWWNGCVSGDATSAYLIDDHRILRSTDAGVNWALSSTTLGSTNYWQNIACSYDGTKVYAVDASPGYIYTSTNSGSSFTQRTGPGSRSWYGICCSKDGSIVYAAPDGAQIYKSTDSGVNWAVVSGSASTSYTSIDCDDTGTKLLATTYNVSTGFSNLICSFDSGATWTTLYTGTDFEYSQTYGLGSANMRTIGFGTVQFRSGDLQQPKLGFMI